MLNRESSQCNKSSIFIAGGRGVAVANAFGSIFQRTDVNQDRDRGRTLIPFFFFGLLALPTRYVYANG